MDLIFFFCPGCNMGESLEYFERGRESKRSKRTTTRGDIANGDPEFVRTNRTLGHSKHSEPIPRLLPIRVRSNNSGE